jgi:serine protease Do
MDKLLKAWISVGKPRTVQRIGTDRNNHKRVAMKSVGIGAGRICGLRVLVFVTLLGCATGATAATLAPGVLEKLSGATFEVVVDKPTEDPLTYEKPLPLELIPYRERMDKFRPVGTAFAIAPNRIVSAAHVLAAVNGSQYGPLALRNGEGTVYRVDKILKLSTAEDYVEFSLVAPPNLQPLQTRTKPPINTPVFAVGNALGEGLVARDGLYTSDSPEEVEGRWQWLRFSAAASPGNSGGPLVDRNGKVVGVVVRKSPNENLNFALPIERVLEGSEEAASIEVHTTYRIEVMKASDIIKREDKIPLPKTLDEFFSETRQRATDWMAQVQADFMKTHADAIFPAGNSDQLLTTVYAEAFPKLITQSDSGTWALAGDTPHKVQLDRNGYLETATTDGVLLVRLRVPDDVSAADLLTDSKKCMDLVLKGLPLSRPVGSDSVRVTSMGKASEEAWFTDSYQRKWLIRSWLAPFNDTVLTTIALPTPDGMVMIATEYPTGVRDAVTAHLKSICSFFYVSYTGTVAQWQTFLSNPAVLPARVASLKMDFDPKRGLDLHSARFQWLVPGNVLPQSLESTLMLKYTYLRTGTDTVWDLGGEYVADGPQKQRWVGVLRRLKPGPSTPEETARSWQSLTAGTHPWDGIPFMVSGRSEINSMVNAKDFAKGKTVVAYSMSLNAEGPQSIRAMKNAFSVLERGFASFE